MAPLLLILLAGLLLRLAIAALLPPGYDEAYYLFYGHHLALSYFDHPAAVGIWAWLGLHLPFGSFGLRLPGVLSYTLASALLALASQRQLGRGAGLWTAALTGLSPLLLACGGVLLLPDAPLLLLLSAVIYALAFDAPWGLLGLLLGGLTLCKYQALPLLACLLFWALSQPQRRRRLWGPEGFKALAAWAMVSSPLWIWNAQNGWISFLFHGARTSGAMGFNPSGPPLFLLTQMLALFPSIGILLLIGAGPHRPDGASGFRLLLRWLALPQLLLFLLLAGRMQVLVSWLVPVWWLLLPLAGERLAAAQARGARWLPAWGWFSIGLPPILCLLAASHVRFGFANPLLPVSIDSSRELIPPEKLRAALKAQPKLWNALVKTPLIVGRSYYEPGFLALALGSDSKAEYTTFSSDARGFLFWQPPDGFAGRSGVLFSLRNPEQKEETKDWMKRLGPLQPLGTVRLERGGTVAQELDFFSFAPLAQPWDRRPSANQP
jgi:4-amino-4-deoxy-L-arabinose transferase-like glycosyltransferase